MSAAAVPTATREGSDDDALLEALSALLYPNDGALREGGSTVVHAQRRNLDVRRVAMQHTMRRVIGDELVTLFRPQLAKRLARAGLAVDQAERVEAVMTAVRSISTWWPRGSTRVQSPADLAAIATPLIGRSEQEELHIAVVDGRNGLVALHKVYVGTATGTSVRIAELLRPVLNAGGVGFAVVHNHPSGDPEPSEEDLRLTAEVVAAARLLDLEFLDHLVIGHGRWVSIRSQRPTIWAGAEGSG